MMKKIFTLFLSLFFVSGAFANDEFFVYPNVFKYAIENFTGVSDEAKYNFINEFDNRLNDNGKLTRTDFEIACAKANFDTRQCSRLLRSMLIQFKPVCKDGGRGCISDFFKVYSVRKTEGISLVKEYIKQQDEDEELATVICSPDVRKDRFNYIQCSTVDNRNFFEVAFAKLDETVDDIILENVLAAVGKIHKAPLLIGISRLSALIDEEKGAEGHAAYYTSDNVHCGWLSDSLKEFGFRSFLVSERRRLDSIKQNYAFNFNRSYAGIPKSVINSLNSGPLSANQKTKVVHPDDVEKFPALCEISGFVIKQGQLRTAYNIDNMALAGAPAQLDTTIEEYLEKLVRKHMTKNGYAMSSFRCDASTRHISYKTEHDEVLTCYVNNQPVDFLFNDLSEWKKKFRKAGKQAMDCVMEGGAYSGARCLGLGQKACESLRQANIKSCPECGRVEWDPVEEICNLPDGARAARHEKTVNVALIVGGTVVGAVMSWSEGPGMVIVEVVGGSLELIGQMEIDGMADDFFVESNRCQDASCAETMLKKNLTRLARIQGEIIHSEAVALDYEMARLMKLIPKNSEFYKQLATLKSLEDFDDGGIVWGEAVRALGIALQLTSVGKSVIGSFGKNADVALDMPKTTQAFREVLDSADDLVKVSDDIVGASRILGNVDEAVDASKVLNNTNMNEKLTDITSIKNKISDGFDNHMDDFIKSKGKQSASFPVKDLSEADLAKLNDDLAERGVKLVKTPSGNSVMFEMADDVGANVNKGANAINSTNAPSNPGQAMNNTPNTTNNVVGTKSHWRNWVVDNNSAYGYMDNILDYHNKEPILRKAAENSLNRDYYRVMITNNDDVPTIIKDLQDMGYHVSSNTVEGTGERFLAISKDNIFGAWNNAPGNWLKNGTRSGSPAPSNPVRAMNNTPNTTNNVVGPKSHWRNWVADNNNAYGYMDNILDYYNKEPILRKAADNSLNRDYYRVMITNNDDVPTIIKDLQDMGYHVSSNTVEGTGERFLAISKDNIFGAWDNAPGNWLKNNGGVRIVNTVNDVSSLRNKASNSFSIYLSDVKNSPNGVGSALPSNRLTEAEWDVLNRSLAPEGIQLVDSGYGHKIFVRSNYDKKTLDDLIAIIKPNNVNVNTVNDVSSLRNKASNSFSIYLSDVKNSPNGVGSALPSNRLTEAEWDVLNRSLAPEGLQLVDSGYGHKIFVRSNYDKKTLDDLIAIIKPNNVNVNTVNDSRIFSKVYDNMSNEEIIAKLDYVYNHSGTKADAIQALKAVGAFNEENAARLADDLANEIAQRIKSKPDLINKMKQWDYLPHSERRYIMNELHEATTTTRRSHAGNTIVGDDVGDYKKLNWAGWQRDPGPNSPREFQYDIDRSLDGVVNIIIHENVHAFQSLGKSSIPKPFLDWASRNYVNQGQLYWDNILETEAHYIGNSASQKLLRSLGL